MKFKEMNLTFGQKFKSLRQISGRTEAEIAELLKKPVTTYTKLEEVCFAKLRSYTTSPTRNYWSMGVKIYL